MLGFSCRPFYKYHSLTYDGACNKQWYSGSCVVAHGKKKLCVISLLMVCCDVANWTAVDGGQERSQQRSLGDADLEVHSWWLMLTKFGKNQTLGSWQNVVSFCGEKIRLYGTGLSYPCFPHWSNCTKKFLTLSLLDLSMSLFRIDWGLPLFPKDCFLDP